MVAIEQEHSGEYNKRKYNDDENKMEKVLTMIREIILTIIIIIMIEDVIKITALLAEMIIIIEISKIIKIDRKLTNERTQITFSKQV